MYISRLEKCEGPVETHEYILGLMGDNQKYKWTDRLTYGRTDAETRRRQTGKGENVHSMQKCPADAASHLDFIFRVSDFPPQQQGFCLKTRTHVPFYFMTQKLRKIQMTCHEQHTKTETTPTRHTSVRVGTT